MLQFTKNLSGRTGRIGHRGLATSFYTEKDEPIASVLVRTLLETQQPVPDFLAHHMPEGEDLKQLKFESENELGVSFGEEGSDGAGSGWGAAEGGDDAAAGGWGAGGNDAAAGGAWGPAAGCDVAGDSGTSGGGWGAPPSAPSGW